MRRTASKIFILPFRGGSVVGRPSGEVCLNEAASSKTHTSFSSLAKGAGRAWGLACTLLLFLFFYSVNAVQAATPGTLIQNTAQASYRANQDTVLIDSNTVQLTTSRAYTAAQIELLQYAPFLKDATPVQLFHTNYDADGTTGGATEQVAAIYAAGSAAAIDLSQPVPLAGATIYHQGEPVFFRVTDLDQNIDPTVQEHVWILITTQEAADRELLLLLETEPDSGTFIGYIQSNGSEPAQHYNGALEVNEDDRITMQYTDIGDAADTMVVSAMVDPYGLVFDSSSGQPVDNVRLTLVAAATGLPATVYGDDGVSAFPSEITSGGRFTDSSGKVYAFPSGQYRFPYVAPGTYRLIIQPPDGYSAPSQVSTAVLQTLPGAPFIIAEPGSRGEDFTLNPGPAVRMDIPVDPVNSGLWLQKTAGRKLAAVGDFVHYSVKIHNTTANMAPGIVLVDRLPRGFRHTRGSTRLNNSAFSDPRPSTDGRTLTFDVGDLAAGAVAEVEYIAQVGANVLPGRALNQAKSVSSTGFESNTATAMVEIKEDLFRSENIIVGRVILDNCSDTPMDKADGVPRVRVYLEDGTYVVTDAQGKYHFQGVSSGTHVVQLDLETLPGHYEMAACEEDSRMADTPYSRFVELSGGSLWRVDFHLKTNPLAVRQMQESEEVVEDDQVRQSPQTAPVQDFEQIDPESLEPGFAWLMPAPDFYPAIPSVKLAVKHSAKERVEVRLDGRALHPLTFEGRRPNKSNTMAASLWSGVGIKEGDNHFVAVRMDRQGRELQRLTCTVHYSGPPVKAELVNEASRLIANGKDAPVIAVRLTDKDGHPARYGVVGEFSVSSPYKAYQAPELLADEDPIASMAEEPHYSVGRDGIALIRLAPTTQTGRVMIRFPFSRDDNEVEAWLQPGMRDWILVGLAHGTVGHQIVSGHMENLTASDQEEDFYKEGRVAFFAKGKIKGKWLLTAAYDSDRHRDDRDTRLFQTVDPDTYYTLYGDDVQQEHEASSIRNLYLKIEREQFYALFGDYDTGLTITELSRYSRRFNGLKSEYNGTNLRFNLFASDTDQVFIKDEIRGDGTSGLYHLSRRKIVFNSETVVLETRDRFRSEVIVSSCSMNRHVDYDIDYDAGTLFFKSPVYSRDENFNPIFIVVEYESRDASDEAHTYGGRGSVRLLDGRLEMGATYIHEGPEEAEGDLGGLDARIDLGHGVRVKAEAAATRKEKGDDETEGQAYLVEVTRQTADLDTTIYFREQGKGFGLGQQNGGENATRKIGADLEWQMQDEWILSGEYYRQQVLDTWARRDLGEAKVSYNRPGYRFFTGLRIAEDRLDDGQDNQSAQLLIGGSRRFMDNRLETRFSHDQSVGGQNESIDFPTRTIVGADYKITDPLTVYAEHEMTQGENQDFQTSRVGLKVAPWSGAEIGTSVGQQLNENGERLFANLGLYQTWRINDRWRVDGGLDRTQTVSGEPGTPFDPDVPTAAGAEEDFTALSLGAGYRAVHWSWTGRMEGRTADSQDKWGLITGIAGEVRKGLGLSAGIQLFDTQSEADTDSREGDLRLSLAYRPVNTRWIVLDRLDYIFETQKDADQETETRRIVNNLNANYKPGRRVQLALQYGAKYVFSTIDENSYTGYTDLTGLEVRYDLTPKWDLGLQASVLHVWKTGQLDYRSGLSLGYALMKNMWISLGYNFTGFEDEDFSAAEYTAQGPYMRFRFKFDQQSVKEMVSWFEKK